MFQTAPSIPRKHSQPKTNILTCLTTTVHICLNYASILKQSKGQRSEEQQHKLLQKSRRNVLILVRPEYILCHWKEDRPLQRPKLLRLPQSPYSQSVCSLPPMSFLPANHIKIHYQVNAYEVEAFCISQKQWCGFVWEFLTCSSNTFVDKFAKENASRKSDKTSICAHPQRGKCSQIQWIMQEVSFKGKLTLYSLLDSKFST